MDEGAASTTRWITTQSSTGRPQTGATETPMLPPNASGRLELLLVVPSLPKGSQSVKHLYSTNSPAGRNA
jgi:hypothetical protein